MTRLLFQGDLMADYFQIYVCDRDDPVLPDDFSDQAVFQQRVTTSAHALLIHTVRNMPVPIMAIWHDRRPVLDLATVQHATLAGLTAPCGCLIIAGLTDDPATAPHFAVPPGPIGAIVTFAGLDTLDETGLEGRDSYAVHLWAETAVLALDVFKRSEHL